MWVRGLKLRTLNVDFQQVSVAPHVGAWIETSDIDKNFNTKNVAPHVGAWIETPRLTAALRVWIRVAPHVGAWIETVQDAPTHRRPLRVAPHVGAWIETIPAPEQISALMGRTPCGCVD